MKGIIVGTALMLATVIGLAPGSNAHALHRFSGASWWGNPIITSAPYTIPYTVPYVAPYTYPLTYSNPFIYSSPFTYSGFGTPIIYDIDVFRSPRHHHRHHWR